jgi:predicted transcriptional regulator
VSAYVSNNSVPSGDLPALINQVHSALNNVGGPAPKEAAKPEPAVSIRKSVTPNFIVSLFDGKKYKSLKRHIRVSHDMTPEQYRTFWGLPRDYPMVAPNYAKARSELAKSTGLGQKAAGRKRAAKRAKKHA